MTENSNPIKLTDWNGDSDSLIVEMKRRAGVRTDGELATRLGLSQSAVAHWRRRKAVPQSALLSFERLGSQDADYPNYRIMCARALAMRLAEYDYQKLKNQKSMAGRKFSYTLQAMQLDIVSDECCRQLKLVETKFGIDADQALGLLIEDEVFLSGLSEWASNIPAHIALFRLQQAGQASARRQS
jgi:hypothetical protein